MNNIPLVVIELELNQSQYNQLLEEEMVSVPYHSNKDLGDNSGFVQVIGPNDEELGEFWANKNVNQWDLYPVTSNTNFMANTKLENYAFNCTEDLLLGLILSNYARASVEVTIPENRKLDEYKFHFNSPKYGNFVFTPVTDIYKEENKDKISFQLNYQDKDTLESICKLIANNLLYTSVRHSLHSEYAVIPERMFVQDDIKCQISYVRYAKDSLKESVEFVDPTSNSYFTRKNIYDLDFSKSVERSFSIYDCNFYGLDRTQYPPKDVAKENKSEVHNSFTYLNKLVTTYSKQNKPFIIILEEGSSFRFLFLEFSVSKIYIDTAVYPVQLLAEVVYNCKTKSAITKYVYKGEQYDDEYVSAETQISDSPKPYSTSLTKSVSTVKAFNKKDYEKYYYEELIPIVD